MTNERAIEILDRRTTIPGEDATWEEINEAIDIAIDCLKSAAKSFGDGYQQGYPEGYDTGYDDASHLIKASKIER